MTEADQPDSRGNRAIVQSTVRIVEGYVRRNPLSPSDMPSLIDTVHSSLARLLEPASAQDIPLQQPAISVRRSLAPDYLVCLECGNKFLSIKRHLTVSHGLTPGQYRSKWDLRSDYPMTAPSYASLRSKIAKETGLGKETTARLTRK